MIIPIEGKTPEQEAIENLSQRVEELEASVREWSDRAMEFSNLASRYEEELATLRQQQGEPVAYLRDDGDGGLEFSAPGDGFAVYREAAPKQQDKPVAKIGWAAGVEGGITEVIGLTDSFYDLPVGTKLYREASPEQEHVHADDVSDKRVAETAKNKHEPVAEIVLESMGVPGSDAMRARIHFFKNIPPPGTKLYREAAPRVPDCNDCANRGHVDGLSQETHCEHCIYGSKWKTNHFVPKLTAAPEPKEKE